MFWTATRALIGQVIEPSKRRGWFALQTATRNAGYGVGGLLGALVIGFDGTTALHVIVIADAISFACAATAFWRWRAPAPLPTVAGGPDAKAQPKASYRSILTDPRWLGLIGVNLVFVLCAITLDVLLDVYLVDNLHQPAWLAGLLYALNTFLVVATRTLVTGRTRKLRTARVLRAAALGWAASFALLWALLIVPPVVAVPVLVISVVLFTMAQLLQGPAINALAVNLARRAGPAHGDLPTVLERGRGPGTGHPDRVVEPGRQLAVGHAVRAVRHHRAGPDPERAPPGTNRTDRLTGNGTSRDCPAASCWVRSLRSFFSR
jgi:hypothetical protein